MDQHVIEYFRPYSDEYPRGNFHRVIPLHEAPDLSWDSAQKIGSDLSRGWYELAQLSIEDRIGFSHDFWLAKLPYSPGLSDFIDRFFSSLDDVGIFICQRTFDDPLEASLVYSIRGNGGFFRGMAPISEENQENLRKSFPDVLLPNDYMSFLQIHDGYCKATDCTGIIPSKKMKENYEKFQKLLQGQNPITTKRGAVVDPVTLIPFYESFGMPFFQCFWSEWYPEQEMGNVYYSGESKTISDIYNSASCSETMAFPTFASWLIFYLERVE